MKKTMKIMAMVLFVVGMTAFTSCTKSNEKMILGKWKLETMSYTYLGQTIEMTMSQIAEMLGGEEMDEIIIEFKNDGYSYVEDQATRYSVDDNTLTFYEEEGSIVLDIIELTRTTLSFGTKDEETGADIVANLKRV